MNTFHNLMHRVPSHLVPFLAITCVLLLALGTNGRVSAEETPTGGSCVTVRLHPRAQWDPYQKYLPAVIVATRKTVMAPAHDWDHNPDEYKDGWFTVVYRKPSVVPGTWSFTKPVNNHSMETYYTLDNRTYIEQSAWAVYSGEAVELSTLQPTLDQLLVDKVGEIYQQDVESEMACKRSREIPGFGVAGKLIIGEPPLYNFLFDSHTKSKRVLRDSHSQLWEIPREEWNDGERALLGEGGCVRTEQKD